MDLPSPIASRRPRRAVVEVTRLLYARRMKPRFPDARAIPSALCLVALALACRGEVSQGPLDAAYRALQSGDAQRAVTILEPHLQLLDVESAPFLDGTLLLSEALATVAPSRALQVLSEVPAARLASRDWDRVAATLQSRGHLEDAARLTDAGLKRWPGDTRLVERMEELKRLAASGGQPGLASALKGLGYLGG